MSAPAAETDRPLRLHTIVLGCQMSAADGAEMAAPLERRGFAQTDRVEDADAVLISTCTVRQHAEDRALSLIGSLRPWKEADERRLLIVAGCAAERLGDWISKRFPYVDLVVGAKSIADFPDLVRQAMAGRFDGPAEDAVFEAHRSGFLETGSPATSFVTVMRGCNYSCSYCIVPSVRGREIYRPAGDILAEARRKVEGGVKELTLLGQTVNSYSGSLDGAAIRFPELLRQVGSISGLERLRFMSPHPHFLNDAMLDAMAETPAACELLHMPVQSGSDRLLKMMRRNYTAEGYLAKIEAARRKIDGVVFSTDIIVGFPTETDEDFELTLSLLRGLRPVSAYCFKYSERAGTESASWPDDVPQEVKEERLRRLNELVDELTERALQERLGRRAEVLCEQPGFGRTRDGFKVRWKGQHADVGRLRTIKIGARTRRTLLGEIDEKEVRI